jgi:hypothetical protein
MAMQQESLATLFSDLSTQIGDLIRQQATLARVEISTKISRLEQRAVQVALGSGLAVAGALALVAAIVLGLIALGLAPWASAGIVGIVLTGIGYLMAQRALARLNRDELAPQVTVQTMKESAEWAKHPTKT